MAGPNAFNAAITARRRNEYPLAPITPTDYDGRRVVEFWRRTSKRFEARSKRILDVRDLATGDLTVDLPADYLKDNTKARRAKRPRLAARKTLPLRMTNVAAAKRPKLRRFGASTLPTKVKAAEDLEIAVNAAWERITDFRRLVGKAVQESEYGLTFHISPTNWFHRPDFFDTIDDVRYSRLNGDEQQNYVPHDPKRRNYALIDEQGNKRVRRHYWRDDKGQELDDNAEFNQRSGVMERKAYEEDLQEWESAHLPFQVRVVSATDCLPLVSPLQGPDGPEIDGMIVRTLMAKETLMAKGYSWDGMENMVIPLDHTSENVYGSDGMIWLYELYLKDKRGLPFIIYCVGGQETSIAVDEYGNERTSCINLAEEWGIFELPCKYVWANTLAMDDLDMAGVPLMDPLVDPILNYESLLCSILVYADNTAFPGFAAEINPDVPRDAYMNGDKPRTLQIPQGGGIINVAGPVTALQAGDMGRSAEIGMAALHQEITTERPAESTFGGPGAESGRAMILRKEYLEVAQDAVREAVTISVGWIGERILEGSLAMIKRYKLEGIPVPTTVPVVPTEGQRAKPGAKEDVVVMITERLIAGKIDLLCEYPEEGADLATIQQRREMYKEGTATFTEVRELVGDDAPISTMAEIIGEQMLKDPQGMAEIRAISYRSRGQMREAKMMELVAQGRMTPDGKPIAALSEVFQGGRLPQKQPGAGQPTATGMAEPNRGGMALGSEVAAGVDTGPQMADQRAMAGVP